MTPILRTHLKMKTAWLLCLFVLLIADDCRAGYGSELKSYAFGTSHIVRDDKRDRVYCTVPAQNSVAVIDSESLQVLATVFTGSQPNALSVAPDGSKLFVAHLGSSSQGLAVLDLETLSVARYIETLNPVLQVAAGTNTVYTVEGSAIRAYDIATGAARSGTVTGVSVYGGNLVLSPDSTTLYYYQSGLSPSTWSRINVASWPGTLLQSGQWGSSGQGLALSADGQWITFVSGAPYFVRKHQASDPTVSAGQFNTDAYPRGATYSPDGNTLFTVHTSGAIDVFNANTYVATTSIPTTGELNRLQCDRKGKVLFAGNSFSLRAFYVGATGGGEPMDIEINQAVEIRWNSTSGYLYQVEWTTAPSANATWHNLGGQILGNGLIMSVYDTTRNNRAKFYRVRQVSQ
jgi:YVTN family beta-propeller protein